MKISPPIRHPKRWARWLGYYLTFFGAASPGFVKCEEALTVGLLVGVLTPFLLSLTFGIALLISHRREGVSRWHTGIRAVALALAGLLFGPLFLFWKCAGLYLP